MKVKELIEQLKQFDENLDVLFKEDAYHKFEIRYLIEGNVTREKLIKTKKGQNFEKVKCVFLSTFCFID